MQEKPEAEDLCIIMWTATESYRGERNIIGLVEWDELLGSTTPPYFARGLRPLARGGRGLSVFSPLTAVLFDTAWAVKPRSGSSSRTSGHGDWCPSIRTTVGSDGRGSRYVPKSDTCTASSPPYCASCPLARTAMLREDGDSACSS